MPTGEYAQYDCIVKFTTKRKNRGGNIMVSGMQGLNKNGGGCERCGKILQAEI